MLAECEHRKKWEEGVLAARERVAKAGGKPFLPASFRGGDQRVLSDSEDEEESGKK